MGPCRAPRSTRGKDRFDEEWPLNQYAVLCVLFLLIWVSMDI
jgi:hypothetical protein